MGATFTGAPRPRDRWENDGPVRLTHRGRCLMGWLVGIGVVIAPGLSEAIGTWITGTPS